MVHQVLPIVVRPLLGSTAVLGALLLVHAEVALLNSPVLQLLDGHGVSIGVGEEPKLGLRFGQLELGLVINEF